MKIVQINTFSNGSTGKMMHAIDKKATEEGHECYMAWARGRRQVGSNEIKIGSTLDVYTHGVATRFTDKCGFYSKRATEALIETIKSIRPDRIHLHCLHGYYINIEVLFKYLKDFDGEVFWTMHDCWAFTGHCCNFELIKCDRWMTGCFKCPQKQVYPKSIGIDSSKTNWLRKKELFSSVENLRIIAPSEWLANIARKSFMGDCEIVVERNSIDLTTYRHVQSNIKQLLGLEGKRIVLGVANKWIPSKGIEDLLWLREHLDDVWTIVVVGLSAKQIKHLPIGVMGIERTDSVEELVKLYSCADVFVNPTYEDNYPTVNLEAQACGTPVVCYDTGGCRETQFAKAFSVVPTGNKEMLLDAVKRVCIKSVGR